MIRNVIHGLIVLALLNAAYNAQWCAALPRLPLTPIYTAALLAALLMLLLWQLERTEPTLKATGDEPC